MITIMKIIIIASVIWLASISTAHGALLLNIPSLYYNPATAPVEHVAPEIQKTINENAMEDANRTELNAIKASVAELERNEKRNEEARIEELQKIVAQLTILLQTLLANQTR